MHTENRNGYYTIFKTEYGWIGLSGSAQGLSRTTLPLSSENQAAAVLGDDKLRFRFDSVFFSELINKLQSYFRGNRVDFNEILDSTEASPFQQKVWEATRLIAYGQTRSYGWIADQIGKPLSARAVGQALNKNPLPIIVPCHRVIASSGHLCGFAGGLDLKQKLLAMESKMNTG